MNSFYQLVENNPLFAGVPEDKLDAVLHCLQSNRKSFASRTLLYTSGETVPCLGLVLSGRVEIFLADAQGNQTLLSQTFPGELFGQSLAVTGGDRNIYEIYTSEKSEILFLYVPEFTSLKNCHCTYRFKVMENLMKLVSRENIALMMKIQILTQNSLRQKILLYLSMLSQEQGSRTVALPFGREKFSSYLCSDRSAVSRELGRMKKEGVISLTRDTITLL